MTPGLEQSLWSWPEARLEVGSAHELCQEALTNFVRKDMESL